MATSGELIDKAVDVLDLPKSVIDNVYRSLREAGFVSKGGRGLSAAKMTVRDITNLLIALGGTEIYRDAPKAVDIYRQLPLVQTVAADAPATAILEGFGQINGFGTFVERIVELESSRQLPAIFGQIAHDFPDNFRPYSLIFHRTAATAEFLLRRRRAGQWEPGIQLFFSGEAKWAPAHLENAFTITASIREWVISELATLLREDAPAQ